MAAGVIARIGGNLLTKALPKVVNKVGGKAGKEIGEQFFSKVGGKAGGEAGKKIFRETVEKSMKGDKSAFSSLKGMADDLLKIPGMKHGIVKTIVDTAFQGFPGGRAAGSFVSKLMGFKPDSALGDVTKTLD